VFAVFGGAGAPYGSAAAATASARGLPMLLVPVVVIALLLAGRHLVHGLLVGIAVALGVGLAFGLLTWGQAIYIDHDAFTAKGLVIDGITRGLGVSVFTILLVGLVSTLTATGLVERVVGVDRAEAETPRGAELRIFGAVSAAVLLTTHSVVAILTVGELASRLGARVGLTKYRRANLLDVTVCTYPFLLPYFIPPILTASATASGVALGLPRVSPWMAGLHNVYSWALLVVVLVAIVTGFGRTEGAADEP
jgi:Na+/H+ antiporter NhaC